MKKYEIPTEGIQGYGSHIPFLQKELEEAPDNISVLEFGCGSFSTLTFLNCEKVTHVDSIEMQSELWRDHIRAIVEGDRCMIWDAVNNPEEALRMGRDLMSANKYHIAFVDGHEANRPECVNICIEMGIPVILVHDYQCDIYGWKRIDWNEAFWQNYGFIKYKAEFDQVTLCLKLNHNSL